MRRSLIIAVAALALLACTLEHLGPGWGYRTFLVGCGLGALAVGLGGWRREHATADPEQRRRPGETAALWVRVAGVRPSNAWRPS